MKKLMALLLAIAMIFVLCACGNQNGAPTDPATEVPTDAPTDAPTDEPIDAPNDGTLSAPVPAIQSKTLDISFGYSDANGNFSGNMVIIDGASPAVLYLHVGGADGETYIFERDDNGEITKYDENEDGYTYSPNVDLTQDELRSEVDALMNYFVLCGWNFTDRYPNFRYQALSEDESYEDYVGWINPVAYTEDDDVWYKIFDGEELIGFVAVDPETGIFKYVETSTFQFGVLMYDTEGEIPVYYK